MNGVITICFSNGDSMKIETNKNTFDQLTYAMETEGIRAVELNALDGLSYGVTVGMVMVAIFTPDKDQK